MEWRGTSPGSGCVTGKNDHHAASAVVVLLFWSHSKSQKRERERIETMSEAYHRIPKKREFRHIHSQTSFFRGKKAAKYKIKKLPFSKKKKFLEYEKLENLKYKKTT